MAPLPKNTNYSIRCIELITQIYPQHDIITSLDFNQLFLSKAIKSHWKHIFCS